MPKTLEQRASFYDHKVRQFCIESAWSHKLRRSERLDRYYKAIINLFDTF